jgi:uncharacterized protein (DUF58 family)
MPSARVMQRRSYWVDHLVLAAAALCRRRLTATGMAVLFGLAVSAASGFDTEKSLTHQVFSLLLGVVLVALVSLPRSRFRFTADRLVPRYGSVGTPLRYRVRVRNDSNRSQAGLQITESVIQRRVESAGTPPAEGSRLGGSFQLVGSAVRTPPIVAHIREGALPPLPPLGEAETTIEWLPLRRGVVRLEGLCVVRTDTLGLFKSLLTCPKAAQVVILPRRYPLPPIALPGNTRYQQGGVALASSVGQSDEFVSLRDYRPGDPLRHVDWKAWARAGKPIVREFEDEFFVRHALILDTFTADPDSAVFEEAVSVAASFACTVRTQESLLDLLFVGAEAYCFTAGRGLAHTEQLLEVLAACRPCSQRPFESLSQLVLNHARQVSGCVVILLDWDEPRRQLVQRLQATGVQVLTMILASPARARQLRGEKGPGGTVHILELGQVEQDLARQGL